MGCGHRKWYCREFQTILSSVFPCYVEGSRGTKSFFLLLPRLFLLSQKQAPSLECVFLFKAKGKQGPSAGGEATQTCSQSSGSQVSRVRLHGGNFVGCFPPAGALVLGVPR